MKTMAGQSGRPPTAGLIMFISVHMALGQNLVALVNIKIAGKWVFTPLTLIIIGFDTHTHPYQRITNWIHATDGTWGWVPDTDRDPIVRLQENDGVPHGPWLYDFTMVNGLWDPKNHAFHWCQKLIWRFQWYPSNIPSISKLFDHQNVSTTKSPSSWQAPPTHLWQLPKRSHLWPFSPKSQRWQFLIDFWYPSNILQSVFISFS